MEIQKIFVVGAGTMGNGIAQVAATSGYQVTVMDVVPEQLERAQAGICEIGGKTIWQGCAERSAAGCCLEHHLCRRNGGDWRGRPGDRGSHGKSGAEAEDLPRYRCCGPPRGDPGLQHLVDQHHQDRRGDQTPGEGDRDALHEPGAADEAGGGDPRAGYLDRDTGDGDGGLPQRWARNRWKRTIRPASSPTASCAR